MSGFDVIVCGSLHLDIMVAAPHLPRLDETAVGTSWRLKCGGKGGNQAVMAAAAGSRTAMIGRVGDDDFGRRLLANLETGGVETRSVAVDKVSGSGMSVAIENPAGGYGAVIVSGTNLALSARAVTAAWRDLGGASLLLLQNEVPEPANIAAARAAKAAGARVVLNAAPARVIARALLDLVDILVVNRVEAEMLSGAPVESPDDAVAALPALGLGLRNVVVTLGGDGVVVGTRDRAVTRLAAHPVDVVATHGAGDCFVGHMAHALVRGATVAEAATRANDAAGVFVGSNRNF